MNDTSELCSADRYLFIFAHPDDELYCAILMHRLLLLQKRVATIHVTSGDAGQRAAQRERELDRSLTSVGVPREDRHLLRVPELALLGKLREAVDAATVVGQRFKPDCIVGQDYEGGHEGHDAASFIASRVAQNLGVRQHIVFPIYHGKPQKRKGARFKPERTDFLKVALSPPEQELKRAVLAAHAGQASHFTGLQKASPDYLSLLMEREVFAVLTEPIDYVERPTALVGYEFHRNGFTFKDFQAAIRPALQP